MQSLSSQLFAFGVTVLGGFLFGLLFDIYRVARGVIKPKKLITHIGDLVFWVISTTLLFIFLLFGNWGEVRLYVFIGFLLGIFLYVKIFSAKVIKLILLAVKVVRTVKLEIVKLVLFLYRIISYPFNLAQRIVLIPIGFIGGLLVSLKMFIKSVKIYIKKVITRIKKTLIKKPPCG